MRNSHAHLLATAAIVLLSSVHIRSALADRGMISVSSGVSVYEPGQKAIIAWNGHEEILILSTDVTSSQETLVLEILPLPSQPEVESASFKSFTEIQTLIWQEGFYQGSWDTMGDTPSRSIEIIFQEKIGAHNITVVKADNTAELVGWMQSFVTESGVDGGLSLKGFESVISNYADRGFQYYVLDLIDAFPEEKSVEPILYKFNSSFLYYPLAISTPVEGTSNITLFLLTEGPLGNDYQHSLMRKAQYHDPETRSLRPIELEASRADLSQIDLRIGELFEDEAHLTVLTYDGKLRFLSRDLMISDVALDTSVDFAQAVAGLVAVCILCGAAYMIIGIATPARASHSKAVSKEAGDADTDTSL